MRPLSGHIKPQKILLELRIPLLLLIFKKNWGPKFINRKKKIIIIIIIIIKKEKEKNLVDSTRIFYFKKLLW